MFERLRRRAVKENRLDDADDKVIRNRWDVYERETQPVLDCYPKDLIGEVDAIGTPARIFRDVLDIVIPIQEEHFKEYR